MPRSNPLQASLNAGEFSPRMVARVDFRRYGNACAVLKNMTPLPQGGAMRRPGTRFVQEVKDSTALTRLVPFEFSTEQAYIVESGNFYFRFFRNQARIAVADTDAAISNGTFDSDLTDWTDQSTGAASIAHNGTLNALDLVGATGETAVAEQSVAVGADFQSAEHVLKFAVLGIQGDAIKIRIGTASGGEQVLEDTEFKTGFHTVSFTPGAATVFLQFRNERAKTVAIDNVALIDNAPVEIETPYATADLEALKWAQNANDLYIAHPDYPTYRLGRRSNVDWSLVRVDWDDGPYLDQNGTPTTLDPSANTGLGITITASAVEGINDGKGFLSTDVGRLVRLKNGTDWGYAVITAVNSTLEVVADVKRDFAVATPNAEWQLGAWSDTTGFPSVVTFLSQRLVTAATRTRPQTFWMSQSADIENQRPDSLEGSAIEVQDDDALDFTIAAKRVNAIRWLWSGTRFIMGTAGGEWVISSDGPTITPSDIDVRQQTAHGSSDVDVEQVGSVALFIQRAQRKLRMAIFDFDVDGLVARDMTLLADHILRSGVRDMAYQEEPDRLLWCVRKDGVLPAMTVLREEGVFGWGRHIIGGSFAGGNAVVESVATVPGDESVGAQDRDELWMIVKRTINGVTRRYVEFLEAPFEGPTRAEFDSDEDFRAQMLADQKLAFYSDSCLSETFGSPVTVVSGLDHLEGETVKVLGDGAVLPDAVVSGGQITLDQAVSTVVVGLRYQHRFVSLKLASGAAAGTAMAKTKQVHRVGLVVRHAPEGLEIGRSESEFQELVLRDVADAMDTAVPLFDGEVVVDFEGEADLDPRIVIQGDVPLPFQLLGIAPEMDTKDIV